MSAKKFEERITTRYIQDTKDTYDQIMDLVKENNIPKATAQLLLVERGLVHSNNPEPLVKEVEKVVYRDRPKEEHITEDLTELDGGKITQQRPSADKLSTGDKANPHLALDEKKSANNSNVGGWLLGLGIVGVIVYGLIKNYTS